MAQQQLPLQWDGRANARSDYQGGHLVSGTYTQDTKLMILFHTLQFVLRTWQQGEST